MIHVVLSEGNFNINLMLNVIIEHNSLVKIRYEAHYWNRLS